MEKGVLNLAQNKRGVKNLPPAQREFYRLQKKLALLQEEDKGFIRDLDAALQFYHERMRPTEQAFGELLAERGRVTYQFYQQSKKLSAKDRQIVEEMILNDLHEVFQIISLAEIPEDIRQMFKNLSGFDYGDVAAEQFGEMKDDLEDMFKEMGVDVDLSQINANDRVEDMAHKLFETVGAAMAGREEGSPKRKRTKKQEEKELRRAQIEELQKKSLNSIYRQLAKALHPDLEPDSEKKAEKAELMKQVTVAYEQGDLHALLALELTWVSGLDDSTQGRSQEQLKIYNEILKEQVKALQARRLFILDSPKYCSLRRFYPDSFNGILALQSAYVQLHLQEKDFREFIGLLKTAERESMIRKGIREFRQKAMIRERGERRL